MGNNGAGDSIAVGTGVQVASNSTDFTNGAISSTDVASDAAIDGSGFFVLDANGGQLLTRNGTFQVSNTGALQSTDGFSVMGYKSVNGKIDTNAKVSDLTIPVGAVMQPSATSTFSMTQNLDSSAAIGSSATGQVKVYDSLGNPYEATITYTKTGANNWKYSIAMPDKLTQSTANSTPATTYSLSSQYSKLDPSTDLTISGLDATGNKVDIDPPTVTAGESLSDYASALNGALSDAGITGVTVNATSNGILSITGKNVSTSGSLSEQPVSEVANNSSSGGAYTYVLSDSANNINSNTSLTITGQNAAGVAVTAKVPVTVDEPVATYAAALSAAATAAGMQGVTVSANGGTLAITGSNISVSGKLYEDKQSTEVTAGSTTNADFQYAFGANGNGKRETVNADTNLTITGTNAAGVAATMMTPAIAKNESVEDYVASLKTAVSDAGLVGVTVNLSDAGVLSISGVGVTVSGSIIADPIASSNTTGTLSFDPKGNLTSPAGNISDVTFAGLSSGAATVDATWQLFNANGNGYITQTNASSTTAATSQNGFASGQYQSYSIDNSGVIKAQYSNGETQQVGQIGIATVTDEEAMKMAGSTNYETTNKSGDASIGVAGLGGRGTIQGSALESSNVNVSNEFSQLIVAQRAFEASSKAITAFNTVSEDVIGLIR